jgi:hypothetical protein
MHPLAAAYLVHTDFYSHQQKSFDVIGLFRDTLNYAPNIVEFHWNALSKVSEDLGLPDYYETIRAVFRVGWEKGDPTGELKALFQEVVNGPLNKELDEYM